ncbi:MAG: lipid II flippase MurJ [Actinomycetaceae bacterium]|nr:lipid II flippase MurJ [Actinomycetaceae bacterium]
MSPLSSPKKHLLAGVIGSVGLISFLTLASRVVGFIRWLTQSAWVGTGAFANAYSSANQIPNVLFEVVAGGALTGITIPLLAAPIAKKMREEVNSIANALLTWAVLLLIPVAVVLYCGAPWIADALPSPAGVDHNQQIALMTSFLRVFAWQIPMYGMCIVLVGVLQAHKKFLWPALVPLLSSLVVITTFALFGWMTSYDTHNVPYSAHMALAWGTTLGVVTMALPLLIPVYRLGMRIRPQFYLEKSKARQALRLGGAGMTALLAQQLSVVVVLVVARAYGGEGTLPIYQYALAVYLLPYAVLAYPVATAMFPRLAETISQGAHNIFAKECALSTKIVTLIGVVSAALLIGEAYPAQAVFALLNPMPGMAEGLIAMAPGLVGYILIFHLQRALYALDAGRPAMLSTTAGWLVVSIASWGFAALFGSDKGEPIWTMIALGLGQSLGMIVAGAGLLYAVYRQAGRHSIAGVVPSALIWSLMMCVVSVMACFISRKVLFLMGSGLGGAITAAFAALFVVVILTLGPLVWEYKKYQRRRLTTKGSM